MIELVAVALLVVVFAACVSVARSSMTERRRAYAVLAAPSDAAIPEDMPAPLVFLRRHRSARLTLSAGSILLLLGAVAMLGYPLYTNLYQQRLQQRLDRELVSPELEQKYREGKVGTGDALTRIKIPRINVDVVVVEGTTASALRAGAGHYPATPLPCEEGNVGIAGHRTTYGKPFNHLDLLRPGDDIILETPIGSCTYKVAKDPYVVAPDDGTVVRRTDVPSLTLTTCHPKGSAKQRLIVRATLQGAPVT
jgi:sortase A